MFINFHIPIKPQFNLFFVSFSLYIFITVLVLDFIKFSLANYQLYKFSCDLQLNLEINH